MSISYEGYIVDTFFFRISTNLYQKCQILLHITIYRNVTYLRTRHQFLSFFLNEICLSWNIYILYVHLLRWLHGKQQQHPRIWVDHPLALPLPWGPATPPSNTPTTPSERWKTTLITIRYKCSLNFFLGGGSLTPGEKIIQINNLVGRLKSPELRFATDIK